MALTYQSEKNVTLSRRNGEELIRLHPATVGVQVALTAQNGVTQTDVQKELEAIHGKMDGLLSEADAMQYKGVVNADGELPTTYEPGWMWKVGTAGTYKGQTCEAGDLIIANVSRAGTDNADTDFDIVQGNVPRPVSGPESSTADTLPAFDSEDGMKLKSSDLTVTAMKEAAKKTSVVIEHGAPSPPDELRADAIVFEKTA